MGARLNEADLMCFGFLFMLMGPQDVANLVHEIRKGGDAGEVEIHEPTYNVIEPARGATYTRAKAGCPQLGRV